MLRFLKNLNPVYLSRLWPYIWGTAEYVFRKIREINSGSTKSLGHETPKPRQRSTDRIWTLDESKKILRVHVDAMTDAIRRRSIPNKRLIIAFHIENAFTTMHVDVHEEYVRQVRELLKIGSYFGEQNLIKDIFEKEKEIFVEKYGNNIPFKRFVMVATFKLSIRRFFHERDIGTEISEKDVSDYCYEAAEHINYLWMQSKTGSVDENRQKRLFGILKKIFPKLKIHEKRENPLGKILPSFETFWRALLRMCIQISRSDNSKEYLEMFREFGQDASEMTYKKMKNNVSVENIIKESLFTNPPTRSIYRSDENNNHCKIDVSKLHEDHMGENTGFYPERWAVNKEIPFLTFGYSTLSCPAKKYAPLALGLMAATIFDIFKEYYWEIDFECLKNSSIGTEEINDRNKYPEFKLIKKE